MGVTHAFVNGEQVRDERRHTGRTPGRFIKGSGYAGPDQKAGKQ
jgi:hypothetical protein